MIIFKKYAYDIKKLWIVFVNITFFRKMTCLVVF